MDDARVYGAGCQLRSIYEGMTDFAGRMNVKDHIWLAWLRGRCIASRRIIRLKGILGSRSDREKDRILGYGRILTKPQRNRDSHKERSVKVRSLEEITRALDSEGKFDGLEFVPAMSVYCGKEMTLLKKVRYMFDERAWRMRKCNNIVILQGATCSGKSIFEDGVCDRRCYFFWKESWIEYS